MAICKYVRKINEVEYIGDSLITLNNNFFNLNFALCNLKKRLDTKVEIRTFFYYGINEMTGVNTPTLNMQNNITSRPSDNTIRNFVNSPNQLNLLPSSKTNDRVYVIYQKTGYLQNITQRRVTGTVSVTVAGQPLHPDTTIQPWEATTPDRFNIISPIFVIWHLKHDGTDYKVDTGFPKFLQPTLTSSTSLWNDPRQWATY
jgi:hypothetical protein